MQVILKKTISFLKFLKFERYNLGFLELTADELLRQSSSAKSLQFNNIKWLKNPSLKRWYADPFIYKVASDSLVVFVEELIFEKPGRLVALTIDRNTYRILEKRVLLELSSHLSYPQIIEYEGEVYVIPENCERGVVSLYRLDKSLRLNFVKDLLKGHYADSTIFRGSGGSWYMTATGYDQKLYLFKSDSLKGEWKKVVEEPIVSHICHSRCGGKFFKSGKYLYRVAQDCKRVYGNSLHIMEVQSIEPYIETEVMHIVPNSGRYNRGLHALDFHESGIAVIDGYGYALRSFGELVARILNPLFGKIASLNYFNLN